MLADFSSLKLQDKPPPHGPSALTSHHHAVPPEPVHNMGTCFFKARGRESTRLLIRWAMVGLLEERLQEEDAVSGKTFL